MELILASYIADLVFGDPQWFPHPVRLMGRLISFLHRKLSASTDKGIERLWGALTTISVVGISGICAYAIIEWAERMHPLAAKIAWVFLAYTTLATKDLAVHADAVWKEVVKGDIEEARQKLSFIVGRDTGNLSEEKIIVAAVESIAESTNDGIIAPLFYLIVGGPVLAVIYKAINTLDSMVGYKNKRYIHFGWFSAKLDDIANFLPARITGFLIPISSCILGKDFKNSFRTMFGDGRKHRSPNSGISEAAMAGALGIKLGGPSTYQGKLQDKPYIGEDKFPTRPLLIKEASSISFVASLLMLSIGVLIKWVI